MPVDALPAVRRVIARNPAVDSENRIHAGEVATRYGFRGGLVPGATVYGYVADLLLEALGPDWAAAGGASVRFRKPSYDGEELAIHLAPSPGDRRGCSIEVVTADGVTVTGSAAFDPAAPILGPVPAAAARAGAERPAVGAGELSPGTVLGSIAFDTSPAAMAAYRELIGAVPGPPAARAWVHPGVFPDSANHVLMAHVVMPLWLHVGSEIRHLRPIEVGEPVQVRARVAREWESKGHRFVTLDVAWVGAARGDVAAEAVHTAIWHLAGS